MHQGFSMKRDGESRNETMMLSDQQETMTGSYACITSIRMQIQSTVRAVQHQPDFANFADFSINRQNR